MPTKNILMLLQTEYPPDVRLKKEIKSLLQAGHNVYLLANNTKKRQRHEIIEGCEVHRLPAFDALPNVAAKLLRLPYPFNLLWYWHAAKIIKRQKIDALHAHDLPMAPFGIVLAKLFGLPVTYDMHENYPAAMAEWNKDAGLLQKIVRNDKAALLLDMFCIRRATRVIVVVDEMKDLLVQRGISSDKITVVSNTVDLDIFDQAVLDDSIIQKYKDDFTILYLGAFSVERGLGTAIEAMPKIAAKIPNAKLLLVGDGKNKADLERFVKKQKAEHLVEFTGWVDFTKVPSYMKASKICIVPQPGGPFIDTTIPHKIFQYMAVGVPVLSSDAKPLKRVVEDSRGGEYFRSNDADSFFQAVLTISKSKENYVQNGRTAVETKYNWSETARTLLQLYESL